MAFSSGRSAGRNDLERRERILQLLEQDWHTYCELEAEVGSHERTLRRDLDHLRRQGYRIETRRQGRVKGFRMQPGSIRHPIEPGILEVIAANLGRGLLGFLQGTELSEQMERLFGQLRAHSRAPEQQLRDLDRKFWFMQDAPRDYRGCDDRLDELVTCIIRQKCADISYQSRERGRETLRIEPYTLVIRRECLYVVGQVRAEGGGHSGRPRPFDVTRVTRVRRTREGFSLPEDWEPSVLFRESFGMFVPREGEPPSVDVRIWFSPSVGRHIQTRLWHRTQRWTVASEGGWHLDMHVRVCPELVHWILGFGPQARVVFPEALEKRVVSELQGALSRYQRG